MRTERELKERDRSHPTVWTIDCGGARHRCHWVVEEGRCLIQRSAMKGHLLRVAEAQGCGGEPEKIWIRTHRTRLRKEAHIDHPVGYLTHSEACRGTHLLFLLLGGVWVVCMAVEPVPEMFCCLLGQLGALLFAAIERRLRG